jgi:hypothetical protein
MRLVAGESKTGLTAFRPRTVDRSGVGEQFWESGHDAKF